MSTPSTATATHPSHHQHYGYPHHQTYQPNPSYPTTTVAGAPRLANPYGSYAINPSTATTTATTSSATTTTLPYPQTARAPTNVMAPQPQQQPQQQQQASSSASAAQTGKRRKQPDWTEFYKNGLPKEVIVIDDSPAPEQPPARGHAAAGAASASNGLAAQQPAGKKRRTGIESAYDVGYYDRPAFSMIPPQYGEDSSAGSLSTDRTASLHTTAPTSLGSQGSIGASNGVYYEDANVGQKRKRVTTRKSTRDEQKRRELETTSDAFLSYIPPPKPPIKAKDVPVPVIRDVSPTAIRPACFDLGHVY